jgi:8-amino-7-oxononanoate synthase
VGTDDAVVFPSGFQLNVGVLPALLRAEDHAFSDALNHASLIDGLRLARAPRRVIPHAASPPTRHPPITGFAWWVTEAIFSMDGDRAHPERLQAHLAAGQCVYLDEAHSFGLFERGLGLAGAHGLAPTALVCTLGKALGCAGAFVAGTRPLCTWIRSRARSFVFSTGLSPALAQRVSAAVDLLRGAYGDDARQRLWDNVHRLGRLLDDPRARSPIFPVHVGDNRLALRVSTALLDLGWHVQPIRPPTVPPGTARLRITITADHTPEQLERFVHDLARVLDRHDLPVTVRRGMLCDASVTLSPPA